MTDNILDKARAYLALSKAATPGPWDDCGASEHNCTCGLIWATTCAQNVATVHDKWGDPGAELNADGEPIPVLMEYGRVGHQEQVANARLIVLARNTGPEIAEALLVAVEALIEIEAGMCPDGTAYEALRKLGIGVGDE